MASPYYTKPRFELYQGDCLNLFLEMPENSVEKQEV